MTKHQAQAFAIATTIASMWACGAGSSSPARATMLDVKTQDGGLYVGGPCKRSDGWQAPDPGIGATFDGSPVAERLPEDAGWLDVTQLPPGIGYCLAPDDVYPVGYFTMNCSVDTDCPDGTFCEGASPTTIGQCRRQCFSSSDCVTGTMCGGTPKAFCQGMPSTFMRPP